MARSRASWRASRPRWRSKQARSNQRIQGKPAMATTTLNPSEVSELIKTRIEKVGLAAEARNEGTVTSVSDGIVRIFGIADVLQGEMIELPQTDDGHATYALALTLDRDSVAPLVRGESGHPRVEIR